ncbi:hypothetical protein [Spirulina sp. 06S082]|uniref:hypothetical protein n=1 Tax=Spirulina sp. 06S082 TaxID=3110248 RepID=UPI002B1FD392|nr:hypothetical protein [Spirulina sp. 06S082]MEA5467911.1 hypothetical protein [Spirulina sp. 06S082]
MLLQKIIDEIKEIPESQQEELYQLIQEFRHRANSNQSPELYETPDEEIIEDIHQAMKEAIAGQTIPLSQMWEGIDVDE